MKSVEYLPSELGENHRSGVGLGYVAEQLTVTYTNVILRKILYILPGHLSGLLQ